MRVNINENITLCPKVGDLIEIEGTGFRMIVKDIHSDYYGLVMIGSNDIFCNGDLTLKGYRSIEELLDGMTVIKVINHKYLTLSQG